ncbi:hypothetical protein QAD02_019733 [Eretmocerus hayati]|uniref:Uncharacterized protein n=1 Tax=Eretmocerus hayati TaxID=131215 RepID=A0ACC2PLL8_9HYME|nr:hypothetical protein QAD02_019733 [Eretmocerus hayati]
MKDVEQWNTFQFKASPRCTSDLLKWLLFLRTTRNLSKYQGKFCEIGLLHGEAIMDNLLNKIVEMHKIDMETDIYGKFYKILSEMVGIGCSQPTSARVSIFTSTLVSFGTAFYYVVR